MWPKFGFFEQDFIDSMATWTTDWPEQTAAWREGDGAAVSAFTFGALPATMENTADAVLLIRALHNLARFESDGGFLTAALQDVYQPTVNDVVWRLPPSLNGSQDDAEQRAEMEAIGESNRMTLKFRQPE